MMFATAEKRRRAAAVMLFWACRVLGAWIIAAPLGAALLAAGVRRYPNGDALLFEPGAMFLVEVVRLQLPELVALLRIFALGAIVMSVLLLLPLSALLVALAPHARSGLSAWWGDALAHLPTLALIGGASLLTKVVTGLLGLLCGAGLHSALAPHLAERSSDLVALAIAALILLCLALLDLLGDLSRAAAVGRDQGFFQAARSAAEGLLLRPARAALAYAAYACLSWCGVLVAALVVGALHVEKGPTRLGAVALVHGIASIGLVALRAAWLSRALALTAPEPLADTPERSVALLDPTPDPGA